jgi:hypothetical protein
VGEDKETGGVGWIYGRIEEAEWRVFRVKIYARMGTLFRYHDLRRLFGTNIFYLFRRMNL